jgi:hypothetical protein
MILDGDDCKQRENNLNVVRNEIMEVVRKEIMELSFVVKVDLVVNLEMIGLTYLMRR